ncbi:keratinocyte-associated protein 2-like [Tripterygium wilfordii]|uniref:Keratinocyte-associated protein 2-like n=2 Tax=Tripterygium wilfordii TaxID=458696 RepID=A0A7J7BUJ0_TRIWF|nr:keratinocyte-associated protein 2-like [Tripterygium wilfordii]
MIEDSTHQTQRLSEKDREIGVARVLRVSNVFCYYFGTLKSMAGSGSSMLYSFLLFIVILSLQEMYRGKLASTELFTILGGFISSLLFLVSLTFIGNFQETSGIKTGWGAVILAEAIALIAASTVHRVCITTCFLFSAGLLYEVNKLSGVMLSKSESKARRL